MLLKAHDLAVGHSGTLAISGIDLAVEAGEFVGLIGPNGAGKSTLLATLSGVLAPVRGQIFLQDRDLARLRPRARARTLTYLPQDPGEDDGFTVGELAEMGRTPHRPLLTFGLSAADRLAVGCALERAGAARWADRHLGTLSGGERQRARIAMALAQEPLLLLADEPTTALDLTGQLAIMVLLSDLARQGLGVMAVLHDLNLASQFCTRLVLTAAGRVLADGPPQTVLTADAVALAYGAAVQVANHPQSGAPYLLPRVALNRPNRSRRIHLVAGGGSGRRLIPQLVALGYELSVGILDAVDSDQQLAVDCNVATLTEAPFAPISEPSALLLAELLGNVDAVVVAPCPFGPSNVANLEAVLRARGPVYLIAPPEIAQRDFAGGRAVALFAELTRNGAEILSEDALLARLRRATTRTLDDGTAHERSSSDRA